MTVLKHHYWLNFTNHDMEPPTWINVMREPISWFESRFWFKRNGWIHKEGARLHENIEDGEVCTLFQCMPHVACDIFAKWVRLPDGYLVRNPHRAV